MKIITTAFAACLLVLPLQSADVQEALQPGEASTPTIKPEAKQIISAYQAVFGPARKAPSNVSVDSPLLGNGDVLMTLAGAAHRQYLLLGKNELWRMNNQYDKSSPVPFGSLQLDVPGLSGATYKVSQDLYTGITTGHFALRDGSAMDMTYRVSATSNLILVGLKATGKDFPVMVSMHPNRRFEAKVTNTLVDGVGFAQREFIKDVELPAGASVAWKLLGKPLDAGQINAAEQTMAQLLRIGAENRRWGFQGSVSDLKIYAAVASDNARLPEPVFTALVGKDAKTFDGKNPLDVVRMTMPTAPLTVRCRAKIDAIDKEANYILSGGEWNKAVSLGLSQGKLRFSINGNYVESASVLPTGRWLDLKASYDGASMKIEVDGEQVAIKGEPQAKPVAGGFTLKAGEQATIAMAMTGLYGDGKDHGEKAKQALEGVTSGSLETIDRKHLAWWANYWSKSLVDIADPVIEKQYYLSLYGLGSCSRDLDFPPAIFGWVTTDGPLWSGDYHLNYNHQAPFYGLAVANRLEQAQPHDTPLLDFMERGRGYAKSVFNTEGLFYPVGIGPKGIDTTYNSAKYHLRAENKVLAFGQRTDAAYGLVNIAPYWYSTRDEAYGRKLYPYVLGVVTFFESYLKWEEAGKRYTILDSCHEGSGQNFNPAATLGLVRNAFKLALDMSAGLKMDEARREKWSHILAHLSAYPLQKQKGRTVFRYTESGPAWWSSNTVGIQHIYPAGQIGLDSDPRLLQIARDTLAVMNRWHDSNGSNSFFPAAARVGLDGKGILAQFAATLDTCIRMAFKLAIHTALKISARCPIPSMKC